jgi:PAS domain-containing protein
MAQQQPIELILARELGSQLVTPIFLVDEEGDLLFYNEPAEKLLGTRYDETGPMPFSEWSSIFVPTGETGDRLPPDSLPLTVALGERRPAHARVWTRSTDGVRHALEVTALPLEGQADRLLGAIAIFWEVPDAPDR